MKDKIAKLNNGIELVNLDARQARVRLQSPLTSAAIVPDKSLFEKLSDKALASQWSQNSKNDNFNYEFIGDVVPNESDYISVDFRALSKVIVPGHWLDWTRDGVLEESVQMLLGATVYANHNFYDINGWLGSVSAVEWDADGKAANGVPGINARYKIDALMNPRIARGLMMQPPAIHSTSMTVLFEFEYSHPDMAADDRWKFFRNLGEEIDGEIVRLIVTRVLEYWEASLVFQGADRLAKQITENDEATESFAAMSAIETADEPSNSDEEKTMKLTSEIKAKLGIEFDGDDVPEADVLKAAESLADKVSEMEQSATSESITELTKRAEAGDVLVEAKRTEVTRLAKLAELGAEEGTLDDVVVDQVNNADAEGLLRLEAYFGKKANDRFPATGRSSQEVTDESTDASGQGDAEDDPTGGLL